MSRAVYIGGFGNGKKSSHGVSAALKEYYEDIDIVDDALTYSKSRYLKADLGKIVDGVDVFAHSIAFSSLVGLKPKEIFAFSPALPTSRLKLLGKTIVKASHMLSTELTLGASKKDALNYNLSATGELLSHPIRNFGPLISGEISRFDAIEVAGRANAYGIPTHLIFSTDDEFFQPTYPQEWRAYTNGTPITYIPGVHDQLVLTPTLTLQTALNAVNS